MKGPDFIFLLETSMACTRNQGSSWRTQAIFTLFARMFPSRNSDHKPLGTTPESAMHYSASDCADRPSWAGISYL